MKIVLLLLFVLLSNVYLAEHPCETIVNQGKSGPCYAGIGEYCCKCFPNDDLCEGCVEDTCPTLPPTTPAPTPKPTPKPTTKSPTTSTTTKAPTTTTTVSTTECTCPPAMVCVPGTTRRRLGKKNKVVGCGQGECDCDGGVVELRYKYRGAVSGVRIDIWYKNSEFKICEFNNVQSGQQVVCNLRGTAPGLVKSGVYKFATETPFVITGPNYSCSAQYHTSCSSDIVGVVQPECTDLVVSGWKDVGNVDDNDGGDCDDAINEVDCECEGDPVLTSTTSNPVRIPIIVGNNCYCDTTGSVVQTNNRRRLGKKGKKGGSKGKKGSKKGKGKKKGDGLGIGDCDCSGGQTELTMMYSGSVAVDIDFFHKDGQKICTVLNVNQGDEAVCNVLDYNNGAYSKLGTNTFLELKKAGTSTMQCEMSIHTSCSRDIVGTYGNDGHNCGTTMIVSGWKDAGNEVSGGECDDGLTLCDCAGTVLVREPAATSKGGGNAQPAAGVCFCSNVTRILAASSLPTTTDKPNKKLSRGFGQCDCHGGVSKIRGVYLPIDPLRVSSTVDITVYYDKSMSEALCEFSNVAAGEENECDISLYDPSGNGRKYTKLSTNTYITLTDTTSGDVVTGSVHTSCSADIVGWAATGAPDFVVTGWEDNSNAGDCDDGFYPCACADCRPFSISGGASSECAKQPGCFVNENTDRCDTLSAALYNGSDAPNQIRLLWVAAVAVIAAFLH
eukprot:87933_1